MLRKSLLLFLLASSSLLVLEAWVLSPSSPSSYRCSTHSAGTSNTIFSRRRTSAIRLQLPRQQQQPSLKKTMALNMVDSIALDSESSLLAGTNHTQVGQEMAGSVQRWLDAEWMPLDIHVKMGQSCQRSYVKCRDELNTDDLMTIMMQVAQDLETNWNRDGYNVDAFVNAWDVANYVSDYLTAKSGIQGCECNAKIH